MFYEGLQNLSEDPHKNLALILSFVWPCLSCVFFGKTYSEGIPVYLNIAPNSVFGVTGFSVCTLTCSPKTLLQYGR